LSAEWDAVAPAIGDAGVFVLPQLRHPLLDPARAVPNDLRLGDPVQGLVLSGPNAGGKTVAMKAVALAALCARAGLHVAAAPGARTRVVLDEIGDGTDPGEGAALAQAVLEALADAGARVIATTHYGLLKEMAQVDARFENASFEFDPQTLAPTYRLRVGTAGASSAIAVAARMGVPRRVLERADELLSREDRRLERTLAELNASRVALEHERREAARLRAETESERAELQRRLEQLQARRDRLYAEMRRDLEQSFRRAHEEVAGVIRALQRAPSAREAERARRELRAIEARAREAAEAREAEAAAAPAPAGAAPIDWRRARPG